MHNNNPEFEIKRKAFHLSGIIFPLLYYFSSKMFIIIFLFLLTSIIIYIDTARHYNLKIKNLVNKIFGRFIREREISGSFALSGTSFMFLGFFISALLFSKGLTINCFLVLIICDAIAAIVGQKIGTRKANDKTIEGSFAFAVSAVFVSLLSCQIVGYHTSFIVIILSSIAATYLEFYSNLFKLDDNLTIPIGYGITNAVLSFILV